MFPDLTCDDVFRIETKRLWLRWPRATDAGAIAEFVGNADVAQMTAEIPHPYPQGEAVRFILKARAENAAGEALHLVVTQKAAGRAVVGLVSARADANKDVEIGYAMAPQVWGKGFATEAVRAMVDLIFNVTPVTRLVAKSRVVNAASRRVLEKSGFTHADTGLDFLPARGGLHPCDRLQLDRQAWHRSAAMRRMPPMVLQRRDGVAHTEDVPEPPVEVPQY